MRHLLMQDRNLVNVNLTKEMKTSETTTLWVLSLRGLFLMFEMVLKPVHRRILYGMNELGSLQINPTKSARITGDVMGKYHPHGERSIYEASCRVHGSVVELPLYACRWTWKFLVPWTVMVPPHSKLTIEARKEQDCSWNASWYQ